MIIAVGSSNPVKLEAVRALTAGYALWNAADVVAAKIPLDVFGHPRSLDETVDGALHRARAALNAIPGAAFGIGLESGLIAVKHAATGYMDVCVCAICDGNFEALGLSPAFEYPPAVTDLILNSGLDASQAYKAAGFTVEEKIGNTKGIIHDLTCGRLDRTEYTKQAVMMALIQLERRSLYQPGRSPAVRV